MEDFDLMPGNAKIWIYQSPQKLTQDEQRYISSELTHFVGSWESHGSKVKGSFQILNDLFVILAVDESMTTASGCSIDKSVHIMENVSQHLKIDFFNRTNVAHLINGDIAIDKLKDFKKLISEGLVNGDTLVFNNTITIKHQLAESWKVKLKDSWLSQFLSSKASV